MGNKLPEGAVEVKTKLNPALKKFKTYVHTSQEQIGKGQVPVMRGTLFVENGTTQTCAVKIVPKHDVEVQMLQQLFEKHSNMTFYPRSLVLIHGIADYQVSYGIVMEEMAASIHKVLYDATFASRRQEWTDKEREELAMQCLRAVLELHKLGVIHRDIKPGNFLVNDSCSIVKICDFGSIKRETGVTTHNLKQFGGTVQYMAPERITDDENFKMTFEQWKVSDLYSVGVVMCEILSGTKPYGNAGFDTMIEKRKMDKFALPFECECANPLFVLCKNHLLCGDASKRSIIKIMEYERDKASKKKLDVQALVHKIQASFVIDVNDIVVGKLLGKGAINTVYQGTYKGVPVAIRQQSLENSIGDNTIQTLCTLRHNHIVILYGHATVSDKLWIVTELFDKNLNQRIYSDDPMTLDEVLNYALDIIEGLEYLHLNNIVHRDLQPYNIYLKKFRTGTIAKISEFSVAASVKYESQTDSYGTMSYLAPEVQQWQPYNTSADVYSFAIMLNEMLTKEPPYASQFMESYSLRTKILQGERPPIANCDTKLKSLIEKCWDNNPANRPTCTTIKHALMELKSELIKDK